MSVYLFAGFLCSTSHKQSDYGSKQFWTCRIHKPTCEVVLASNFILRIPRYQEFVRFEKHGTILACPFDHIFEFAIEIRLTGCVGDKIYDFECKQEIVIEHSRYQNPATLVSK